MSVKIHQSDSDQEIQKAIQSVLNRKRKPSIRLERYFGKVSFGTGGLEYQKKVRNEW